MKRAFVKWTKRFGWFLLVLLITINLFIVLSGRFYLYKGVYFTYLQGETSPTIYDLDKFPSEKLAAAKQSIPWKQGKQVQLNQADIAYIEKWNSTSFMIIKNDQIIFEKYWGDHHPNTVSNSFSAAKTVVSLLIGIAIDEGYIKSLDEPVKTYLPEFTGNGKDAITIRHLLMMASGLDWEESGSNPLSENSESYYGWDLWGLVNRQRVITKPGKVFNYQSGNTQLLGFILEKATKQKLSAYAAEKIWQPIGAESDAFWSLDKENGDAKAFCCMYSTTRDFARLGKLIVNKGKWENKQIIPAWYYKELVANPRMGTKEGIPNTRYGLHVWTYKSNGKDVVYYRGMKGQYIITIPEENLIIVRTGHKRAPNVLMPVNGKKASQAALEKVDHPEDLFRYIEMGRKAAKAMK